MKFRDGYWHIKKNVHYVHRVEVVDMQDDEGKLTIFSTTKKMLHRGSTLNTPVLTTEITSPLPDVLHVKSYHFKGFLRKGPFINLAQDAPTQLTVQKDGTKTIATSGSLSVAIDSVSNCDYIFTYNENELTRSLGHLSGHAVVDQKDPFQVEYLSLGVGETLYGLGERFTPFVKNGQVVDIWNEDGGTCSEQAYKNIPFYLSSRGYGVLVANTGNVSFEVSSEVVTSAQFSVSGQCLEYYIIGGENLKEVLSNYALLTGKPALVPPWSFGLWLSTSFVTDYNEATVHSFIDGMEQREIPLHVFHFDCFWMKEFQWVDLLWNPVMFPNPKTLIAGLHNRGLKVCVWINPYVAQKSSLFDEGMENGYLVKNPDGSVWQWDRWQAGMGLVDFTNPQAGAWYQGKLKALLDIGVDSFKTDFGERIPTDVVYHDGSDPQLMHNYYSYLYNEAVFTLLEKERGVGEAVVFARSATIGGQKFPVHWGGDCSATYESMAESLRGGLSLSLCGFGYWSHDIGGFEQTATPDLFKRWVSFGLLSTHSRLHGNESYRVPWNYDEEASEVLQFFTRLKCSLMPYLFGQATVAHQKGIPMMRAMILEYSEEPATRYLDQQYMLGESLLVAPIFSDDGTVQFYLPNGRWTHLLNNEEIEGGMFISRTYDYFSLPVYVAPNTVLAVGTNETEVAYAYNEGAVFHVFAFDENVSKTAKVFAHDGSFQASCTVTRVQSTFEIHTEGVLGEWAVCLRNIDAIQSYSCGTLKKTAQGSVLSFSSNDKSCIVKL